MTVFDIRKSECPDAHGLFDHIVRNEARARPHDTLVYACVSRYIPASDWRDLCAVMEHFGFAILSFDVEAHSERPWDGEGEPWAVGSLVIGLERKRT